jgi:ABC-2 type transport system permease protein
MRGALHAEWTKLRTTPGTIWLLSTTVLLTVAVSAAAVAASRCPPSIACPVDTTKLSLTGIQLGQAVVALLAVLAITSEYSTGMIRTTLTAMPRRTAVLASKAAILTGLVLAAGAIAVLSLGIATAVRDSAMAIGTVLGLLYLFPVIASVVTDPHWQRHLEQIGPMSAGLAIQATTGLRDLPISPWAGLGVLAAWAAAALLAGGLLLRLRDA